MSVDRGGSPRRRSPAPRAGGLAASVAAGPAHRGARGCHRCFERSGRAPPLATERGRVVRGRAGRLAPRGMPRGGRFRRRRDRVGRAVRERRGARADRAEAWCEHRLECRRRARPHERARTTGGLGSRRARRERRPHGDGRSTRGARCRGGALDDRRDPRTGCGAPQRPPRRRARHRAANRPRHAVRRPSLAPTNTGCAERHDAPLPGLAGLDVAALRLRALAARTARARERCRARRPHGRERASADRRRGLRRARGGRGRRPARSVVGARPKPEPGDRVGRGPRGAARRSRWRAGRGLAPRSAARAAHRSG